MRLRGIALCSLLIALVPAVPAMAGHPPGDMKIERGLSAGTGGPVRAIVELEAPGAAAPVAAQAHAMDEADVVLRPNSHPFIVVEGTGESLSELAGDPRVVSIHRDRAYPPAAAPRIELIGADRAHADGVTGAGQAVAVLDTGIDRDHPAFAGRVVAEACFSAAAEELAIRSLCPNGATSQIGPGAADAETPGCYQGDVDMCDHGTHVAGIAAGGAAAGSPGAGVAPGAGVIAVQIFSRVDDREACGAPTCLLAFESSLRMALDHVASLTGEHRIAAANLSLGGDLAGETCDDGGAARGLRPQIDALLDRGVPTVVAAGNDGIEGVGFPGCLSSAVTVGASDDGDGLAEFSNRGPLLDLLAPGVGIESAVPGDGYAAYSGTSMAAPHVTGALALLAERSPGVPGSRLVERLKATGRPIGYGSATTPRLDVQAALTGTAPSPPPAEPPGEQPEPAPTTQPPPEAPQPEPDVPEPEPEVTVTVTVTVTPPATPACARGSARTALTAAAWAARLKAGRHAALACHLRLIGRASDVFPEVTYVSTPAAAVRLLAAPPRNRVAALDRELLAAWLNWAGGAMDSATQVGGTSTFGAILALAERDRLDPAATRARLDRSSALLNRYVNR